MAKHMNKTPAHFPKLKIKRNNTDTRSNPMTFEACSYSSKRLTVTQQFLVKEHQKNIRQHSNALELPERNFSSNI